MNLLTKVMSFDIEQNIQPTDANKDLPLLQQWKSHGNPYVSTEHGKFAQVYEQAVTKLFDCIKLTLSDKPILHEGGEYFGCWLESTGTINNELLSRFLPEVAEETYLGFATYQREDGMIPYKITKDGPGYRQIQLVTPLARCVWNHYQTKKASQQFLQTMYEAMVKYDKWLMTYRNTRGTGCIEAFSAFDTGHDLSPRFWHVSDTPHLDDSTLCHPHSPIVPFLAPDLTANVYCQRKYLAKIASELGLGDEAEQWLNKAEEIKEALFRHCYDKEDDFFYDVDKQGKFVKIQSDVLLRVLACEVVDDEMFARMLDKYLLNTRKFFAKYPLTSIAMDDPRFDPHTDYNSWAGPTNLLTIIRTAHAFEYHQRYVELNLIIQPIISAMSHFTKFSQTISPWTGKEGYTQVYSPSILAVLDFIERLSGILHTPEQTIWFSGVLPYDADHGDKITGKLAYRRRINGQQFAFEHTDEGCKVYKDEVLLASFPSGLRAIFTESGELLELVGLQYGTIKGLVNYGEQTYEVAIEGNSRWKLQNNEWQLVSRIGVVTPSYS